MLKLRKWSCQHLTSCLLWLLPLRLLFFSFSSPLITTFLSPFVFVFPTLSVCPSLCLSLSLFLPLSASPSLSLSLYLPLSPFLPVTPCDELDGRSILFKSHLKLVYCVSPFQSWSHLKAKHWQNWGNAQVSFTLWMLTVLYPFHSQTSFLNSNYCFSDCFRLFLYIQ